MVALRAKAMLAGGVLVISCQSVHLARAEDADPRAAHERFQRGVEAAQRGELAQAAAEFEAAYALSPKPVVLYNLGQTQSALGRPVKAVQSLRRYLASEPSVDPERRREIEALIHTNELSIGVVELEVVPPDARVDVDAEPATLDGGKLPLAAGRHVIVGTLYGYAPAVLTLDVDAGAVSHERLELRSLTPPLAAPAHVDVGKPPRQALELERPRPEPHDRARTQSILALGTAGLGVVALGLGTAFALSAHDLSNAAQAGGHCDARGCDDVGYPLNHSAHRRAAWATGLLISGGALLVGGVSWCFVLGSSSRASSAAVASHAAR
jgi:tetratricopeptide (TPR) repeat protein